MIFCFSVLCEHNNTRISSEGDELVNDEDLDATLDDTFREKKSGSSSKKEGGKKKKKRHAVKKATLSSSNL